MTHDLAAMRSLIEAERARFAVPGTAVAVVVDGHVVLCEGFGVRDTDSGDAMTADTHFPIASDSKAFTAALLCVLADQGEVDLDAPVRATIPWFEMHDPHATALVSPRDLLSHRTGLPRHDFVWYGETDLTLEDVARSLRHLQPNRQPRQSWQYSNLCFNTAGYLTEQLTGQSWPDAMTERLLAPLGMSSTVFDAHDPSIKAIAQPYKTVGEGVERQVLPERSKVGPAGGIVSTCEDMARWLQARLGGAPEVLSEAALKDLHTPAMLGGSAGVEFPERQSMGYALGTQVESYRGSRVVFHGGNLVGYSSNVCVVPDAGIGIVILTNLHGTFLRDALPLMLIDQLLGLEPVGWGERYHALMTAGLQGRAEALAHHDARATGRAPSRPLADFAGTYEHPAYGTFTISTEGEELSADFHGLGALVELRHRDYDAWDLFLVEFDQSLPVVFTQGNEGQIVSVRVTFEALVAPIEFLRTTPDADPELVKAMLGTYTMGPLTLVIRQRGDVLIAQLPGSSRLTLKPAGDGRFTSPEMPTLTVEPALEAGVVTAIMIDPLGLFLRA